ncbi:sensor histidine kinase [Roseofilum casamattae]|nr:HAMP domain-containing sensor histidine kinase [Roseofilum casamattae]
MLLLTVPVLLILQYATYRKARSSLLETARYNLTESALEKAESLETSINAIADILETASEASALQFGSLSGIEPYLSKLSQRFPTTAVCLQLYDRVTQNAIASTCNPEATAALQDSTLRPKLSTESLTNVEINTILPETLAGTDRESTAAEQLYLQAIAPVKRGSAQEQYILVANVILSLPHSIEKKSLSGYTAIIDDSERIVAHIDTNRIGTNIADESNRNLQSRLRNIVRDASDRNNHFLHLPFFDSSYQEVIAGYYAIDDPTATDIDKTWTVLAIAPLDGALSGLAEIQQTLINLVLGLIAASLTATFILTRALISPVEKLGEHALSIEWSVNPEMINTDFKIKELNELAAALNSMVQRLNSWAGELEKARREANVANELKTEFLTAISHNLRTPLNGIIGSVQLIQDGFCDDEDDESLMLQQIYDSGIKLKVIIDDILTLRSIEQGDLIITFQPVNLNETLKAVVDAHIPDIKTKNLSWMYKGQQPEQKEKIAIEGDMEYLEQVFTNIIDNAIKFTSRGGITISVVTYLEDCDDVPRPKKVAVAIQDTGIGIDPEDQVKLFQNFVLIDGGLTRKYEGTGLGLAIAKRLVEMMGGTIEFYSEGKDKGSTVTITLPTIDPQSLDEVTNVPLEIST